MQQAPRILKAGEVLRYMVGWAIDEETQIGSLQERDPRTSVRILKIKA